MKRLMTKTQTDAEQESIERHGGVKIGFVGTSGIGGDSGKVAKLEMMMGSCSKVKG